jgi:hypothetical protein
VPRYLLDDIGSVEQRLRHAEQEISAMKARVNIVVALLLANLGSNITLVFLYKK